MLTDVVSTIASGRVAAKTPTDVDNADMRKIITSVAIASDPMVVFRLRAGDIRVPVAGRTGEKECDVNNAMRIQRGIRALRRPLPLSKYTAGGQPDGGAGSYKQVQGGVPLR
jgi:hypothetical protein